MIAQTSVLIGMENARTALLVLAAAIITGLRLARDPRAGSKTERVINAVEDGIFLANQIYEKALLRFGQGNIDFKW